MVNWKLPVPVVATAAAKDCSGTALMLSGTSPPELSGGMNPGAYDTGMTTSSGHIILLA